VRQSLLAADVLARLPAEAPEGQDAEAWADLRATLAAHPKRQVLVDFSVALRARGPKRGRWESVQRMGAPFLPGLPGDGTLGGGTHGE
jgi:hypothetical protein